MAAAYPPNRSNWPALNEKHIRGIFLGATCAMEVPDGFAALTAGDPDDLGRYVRRSPTQCVDQHSNRVRSNQPTNDKRRRCVSAPACQLARPAGTLSVADCAGKCIPLGTPA